MKMCPIVMNPIRWSNPSDGKFHPAVTQAARGSYSDGIVKLGGSENAFPGSLAALVFPASLGTVALSGWSGAADTLGGSQDMSGVFAF